MNWEESNMYPNCDKTLRPKPTETGYKIPLICYLCLMGRTGMPLEKRTSVSSNVRISKQQNWGRLYDFCSRDQKITNNFTVRWYVRTNGIGRSALSEKPRKYS